jgi:isovaleryl-CoA dehydrogenase
MDETTHLSLDECRSLVDHAAKYFFDKLHPLQTRMDDDDWFPESEFRALGGMGFMGLTVPESHGGQGLPYLVAGMIGEAMAYANPAVAWSWTSHDNLCLDAIFRNGNEDQRRRYVRPLCEGKLIGALGMTEPGAGSDALGSRATTARRRDDAYVLNGSKIFITNGPVADVLLVYAKTAPERGKRGISAFIVEKTFEGFSVAQKLDKMGFRGSPLGELVFRDCVVPAENLVGTENEGVAVMMSGLDIERCLSAPLAIGPAQRAFDLALDHARTRRQFGQRIGDFQLVQAKLADHVSGNRDRTHIPASRVAHLRRSRHQPGRTRRDSQIVGRYADELVARDLLRNGPGGTGFRRIRLHARHRDQSAVSHGKDHGDRCRYPGDQATDHRQGASGRRPLKR